VGVVTHNICTTASNARWGYLAMLSFVLIAGALMEGVFCKNSKRVEVLVRAQSGHVPKSETRSHVVCTNDISIECW
jgi:hypothetical protein